MASLDLISFFSLFGSPASYIGYIGVGAGLYKVYNRITETQAYAKRANHNSTILAKSAMRQGLLTAEEIRDLDFDNEQHG